MRHTTFDEFVALTRQGTFVPVCKEIMADLLTPVSAFLKIAEHSDYAFLLESVEGGEQVGRYSFLGKDPFLVLRACDGSTTIERAGVTTASAVPFLESLRGVMEDLRSPVVSDLPRFTGGAVGYFAYDSASGFGLPAGAPAHDRSAAPADEACFMLFDTVLAFDHVKHRILLIANARVGADDDLDALYQFACAKVQFLERELERTLSHAVPADDASPVVDDDADRAGFERMVGEAHRRMADDGPQHIVLSRRIDARVRADPFTLYRALRHESPAPYMYFIRIGRTAVVGSSPEMLVRVEGRHVEMHPIAGTCPRGASEEEDADRAEALHASPQGRTVHAALVEQSRGDMERFCEYGTVRMPQYMDLERYSHVIQMVSTVEGRLDEGRDRFDALSGCFPAGTVCGTPKRAAMELIGDLEAERRGLYAGAIGYLDFAGNLDFCTAIRTVVVRDGEARFRAGAGIGPDSDPADAFDETSTQAAPLVRAFDLASDRR